MNNDMLLATSSGNSSCAFIWNVVEYFLYDLHPRLGGSFVRVFDIPYEYIAAPSEKMRFLGSIFASKIEIEY